MVCAVASFFFVRSIPLDLIKYNGRMSNCDGYKVFDQFVHDYPPLPYISSQVEHMAGAVDS
jgi:hypothetical protein